MKRPPVEICYMTRKEECCEGYYENDDKFSFVGKRPKRGTVCPAYYNETTNIHTNYNPLKQEYCFESKCKLEPRGTCDKKYEEYFEKEKLEDFIKGELKINLDSKKIVFEEMINSDSELKSNINEQISRILNKIEKLKTEKKIVSKLELSHDILKLSIHHVSGEIKGKAESMLRRINFAISYLNMINDITEQNKREGNNLITRKKAISKFKQRNKKGEEVVELDPTKEKYYNWILQEIKRMEKEKEDILPFLDHVKDELFFFDRNKNVLKESERNLTGKNYKYLKDIIWELKKEPELKEEQKEEYKILYDGIYGSLIVPITANASCKFGKGTKWCTAAEKDNMFKQYSSKAPLYIWNDKLSGRKFQFHFNFEDLQLMDDKNKFITTTELIRLLRIPTLNNFFKSQLDNVSKIQNFMSFFGDFRWKWAEDFVIGTKDLSVIYEYYTKTGLNGKRWDVFEEMIKKNELELQTETFTLEDYAKIVVETCSLKNKFIKSLKIPN